MFPFVRDLIERLRFANHVFEQLTVFVEQTDQRLVVDRRHLVHHFGNLPHAAIHDRTFVGNGLMFGLLFGFAFQLPVMRLRTPDHQITAQHAESSHGEHPAPHQQNGNGKRDREGHQCRKEPSGNHGQHPGNPVHGTLPPPGPVGKRTTHRHHKGHVSSRKRQLQRRSHRDQQRGDRQVHRRPDQIERRFVLGIGDRDETARDETLNPLGRIFLVILIAVDRGADDRPRRRGRTETLYAYILARQIDLGVGNALGLFREPQRNDHDRSRKEQDQQVGDDRIVQSAHQHIRIPGRPDDVVSVDSGDKHPDEVHQVVAGESERQRKRARQHGDPQDIHLQHTENRHNQAPADQQPAEHHRYMPFHPAHPVGGNDLRPFQPFENGEIRNSRQSDPAPDGSVRLQFRLVTERKDQPRDVHHDRTANKSDYHRNQDSADNRHRIARIDHVGHRGQRTVGQRHQRIVRYFEDTDPYGGSQQPEHQRHGSRSRHSQRIENIQQDHVGEHHRQEQQHDLGECKHLRMENAAAGDFHHPVRSDGSDDDSDRSHRHDHITGCGLGTQGRI